MGKEVLNVGEVLRQCRLFLRVPPEELVALYRYLSRNTQWHPVVCELMANRGLVRWELLERVQKRLKLDQSELISRVLWIGRAFLCESGMELMDEQQETAQGEEAPEPKGSIRKGRRPATLVAKVRCLAGAARQGSESVYKTMRRLVTDHTTQEGFGLFANPILEKAGLESLSTAECSSILKQFPPHARQGAGGVPARTAVPRRRPAASTGADQPIHASRGVDPPAGTSRPEGASSPDEALRTKLASLARMSAWDPDKTREMTQQILKRSGGGLANFLAGLNQAAQAVAGTDITFNVDEAKAAMSIAQG
ncbi:MAG: hypothetical protein PHH01_02375 [Patescibacteria group bacterium]|nr:hypothetical protein [Patescibacteria group bacterium]